MVLVWLFVNANLLCFWSGMVIQRLADSLFLLVLPVDNSGAGCSYISPHGNVIVLLSAEMVVIFQR